jgi:mRNA-degrading endonuclease RelE of RelBE toxin-antitoxin system
VIRPKASRPDGEEIIWSDEARADVKQLEGYDPPQYRLRLGDYRIRFRNLSEAYRRAATTGG